MEGLFAPPAREELAPGAVHLHGYVPLDAQRRLTAPAGLELTGRFNLTFRQYETVPLD